MSCRDVRRELEALDETGGPADLSAASAAHAVSCERCAREVASFRRLREGLAAMRQRAQGAPLPSDLAHQARRAARQRLDSEKPRRASWPLAAGFAAAGLLAICVVVASRPPATPSIPVATTGATHGVIGSAPGPTRDASAMPVVYSDGAVDIVSPPPEPRRVAMLVEWNL